MSDFGWGGGVLAGAENFEDATLVKPDYLGA